MDPDPASETLAVLLQQSTTIPSLDLTTIAVEMVVFCLLLVASALFSGSEVALFSLDWSARERLAQAQDKASKRVLKLLDQPREVLITILILNTVVNVAAAMIAAITTAQIARHFNWSTVITVVIEVVALAFVILVVSEITPKLLARRNAIRFSRGVSLILLPLHRALFPVSRPLTRMMKSFQGRFKPARPLSGDDVKAMAEIGEAHGTLEEEERELIHSILEFGETTVREVMVSRLDIVAIEVSTTVDAALDVIRESGHSRLPLFVEHLDNILGIVHAKDLLPNLAHNGEPSREVDWRSIARRALFVPTGKKLDDLLTEFQATKTHVAIAVDEYGGTAGLITLEDILEEIVGEIRDEYDEGEEAMFEKIGGNAFRCDARIDLDDLNEILGLLIETEEFDFETLGGLILHLSGSIPSVGDTFSYEGLRITVREVDNRRIRMADVVLIGRGPTHTGGTI